MKELQQQVLDVCHCAYPALYREHVSIKPKSCWCREIDGTGVVRIATDFKQESAHICPSILDGEGMRLDGGCVYDLQAMCHGWSDSIFLGYGAPSKRYVVMRNEGDQEVSFNVLFSPE